MSPVKWSLRQKLMGHDWGVVYACKGILRNGGITHCSLKYPIHKSMNMKKEMLSAVQAKLNSANTILTLKSCWPFNSLKKNYFAAIAVSSRLT